MRLRKDHPAGMLLPAEKQAGYADDQKKREENRSDLAVNLAEDAQNDDRAFCSARSWGHSVGFLVDAGLRRAGLAVSPCDREA